jgi:protein-tyrosine phosphatase
VIDIHSHILPGVDDGARDFDESLRMLDLAAEGLTSGIVATPHADVRFPFDPVRARELTASLQQHGLRVYSGCEVHLTPENVARALAEPAGYTLNGGGCLLLELPDAVHPAMADPAIERLAASGLRVIIAHPERNRYMQQHPDYADRLVDAGCYLQLTARSLTGGFGPAASGMSTYLLKRRLAHFVASDAHGSSSRRPGLSQAFETLSKSYGETAARTLLAGNPAAALAGTAIGEMPAAPRWLASLFTRTSHGLRKPTVPQVPSLR